MNDTDITIDARLKSDGNRYQQMAKKRFDASAFEAQLLKAQATRPRRWWLPATVAAGLVLGVWGMMTPEQQIEPMSFDVTVWQTQLKSLPAQVEQSTHKVLEQEQQAIWADLKSLKSQFLSI